MCKVLNVRKVGKPSSAPQVCIGRPVSGATGRDGSRADVIAKYRAWIVTQPALMNTLDELRVRDLVCWCVKHLIDEMVTMLTREMTEENDILDPHGSLLRASTNLRVHRRLQPHDGVPRSKLSLASMPIALSSERRRFG